MRRLECFWSHAVHTVVDIHELGHRMSLPFRTGSHRPTTPSREASIEPAWWPGVAERRRAVDTRSNAISRERTSRPSSAMCESFATYSAVVDRHRGDRDVRHGAVAAG